MTKGRVLGLSGRGIFRWLRPAAGRGVATDVAPAIVSVAHEDQSGGIAGAPLEPCERTLGAESSGIDGICPAKLEAAPDNAHAAQTRDAPIQDPAEDGGSSAGQMPSAPAAESLAALADLPALVDDLRARVSDLTEQCIKLRSDLRHETLRLDHALGELEGLALLRDAFHAARKTAEYQQAFTSDAPLVTVCVTTFNRADILLERAIRSLKEQTYKNLQILVGGDCCTDDTGARLAAVKDDRISFYNLERRLPYPAPGRDHWLVAGTHAAVQLLPHIKGHFITHLDEDDMYEPDRIQIMVDAAKAHRADFLWHKFWYQQPDATWKLWGSDVLEHAQVGLGMTFYHSFFAKVPIDLYAYRVNEPGDWNRLRKIKYMRPTMHFIDQPLTWYYHLPRRPPTLIDPSEQILE